jgi:hypothetical protein
MFMPKRPVSVTLDEGNLLWLRGRMARRKRRSLSDALDEVITAARASGGLDAPRSVAGTIDIAANDPGLEKADRYVRSFFEKSLSRPLAVGEKPAAYKPSRRSAANRVPGALRGRTRG